MREGPQNGLFFSYSGRYGNKARFFCPYSRHFCPYAGNAWAYARPFGMVLRRCDEAFVSSQKPFEKKNEVAASR